MTIGDSLGQGSWQLDSGRSKTADLGLMADRICVCSLSLTHTAPLCSLVARGQPRFHMELLLVLGKGVPSVPSTVPYSQKSNWLSPFPWLPTASTHMVGPMILGGLW